MRRPWAEDCLPRKARPCPNRSRECYDLVLAPPPRWAELALASAHRSALVSARPSTLASAHWNAHLALHNQHFEVDFRPKLKSGRKMAYLWGHFRGVVHPASPRALAEALSMTLASAQC